MEYESSSVVLIQLVSFESSRKYEMSKEPVPTMMNKCFRRHRKITRKIKQTKFTFKEKGTKDNKNKLMFHWS